MLWLPRVTLHALIAALVASLVALVPVATTGSSAGSAAAATTRPNFWVATMNLELGMSAAAVRHDVRLLINEENPSIIGFQEREKSRRILRAALPSTWGLRMHVGEHGTDANPIAYDKRVWEVKKSWPRLLAARTWRRDSGQVAHDQYGTAAVLRHLKTGHIVRAISFHLPPAIHNRSTGGPNWGERDRVEAMWRMATNLRSFESQIPAGQQFIAMCDCNVTESRDTTDLLVKGKITRPLNLENNYSAAGYRNGWRIDYVMTKKRRKFKITNWHVRHDVYTDHPAVITKFVKR